MPRAAETQLVIKVGHRWKNTNSCKPHDSVAAANSSTSRATDRTIRWNTEGARYYYARYLPS